MESQTQARTPVGSTMIPVQVPQIEGVHPDKVALAGGLFVQLLVLIVTHPAIALAFMKFILSLTDLFAAAGIEPEKGDNRIGDMPPPGAR